MPDVLARLPAVHPQSPQAATRFCPREHLALLRCLSEVVHTEGLKCRRAKKKGKSGSPLLLLLLLLCRAGRGGARCPAHRAATRRVLVPPVQLWCRPASLVARDIQENQIAAEFQRVAPRDQRSWAAAASPSSCHARKVRSKSSAPWVGPPLPAQYLLRISRPAFAASD